MYEAGSASGSDGSDAYSGWYQADCARRSWNSKMEGLADCGPVMGPALDGIRPMPVIEGKATFMATSVKEKARACTMLMALIRHAKKVYQLLREDRWLDAKGRSSSGEARKGEDRQEERGR